MYALKWSWKKYWRDYKSRFFISDICPVFMAYNEQLADRIRERFADFNNVEEKNMMGGYTIMYNGKMCVGIFRDELMCRIDPDMQEQLLERGHCRVMEMGGKAMQGYLLVEEAGMRSKKDFDFWINQCISFNPKAKASKKKKK